MTPKRALETIASELQRQYERWQSKARYKSSLDPTQEDIKKLCLNLRRNARVIFKTETLENFLFSRLDQTCLKKSIYIRPVREKVKIIPENARQFIVIHEQSHRLENEILNRHIILFDISLCSRKNEFYSIIMAMEFHDQRQMERFGFSIKPSHNTYLFLCTIYRNG